MAQHHIGHFSIVLYVQCIEENHTPECVQENHAERLGRTVQEKILIATE